MEFCIEKYAILIMKSGKRETIEGIELPNQEGTFWEKENHKYLGILEADIIKDERKSKKKKCIKEQKYLSKTNSSAEISWKE